MANHASVLAKIWQQSGNFSSGGLSSTMLNMDFTRRVVINTSTRDWQKSPHEGVWRKPLAREEAERGHATSIVRYDPGASFHGHNHPLGEEILVLEGTFSDETGDFSAGTYFRNPPGFVHAPFSNEGCVILVKLHQFQPDDLTRLAIETGKAQWQQRENGLKELPLHSFGDESVALIRWPAGSSSAEHTHANGAEIFVIEGELQDEHGHYPAGTWLRMPPGSSHAPHSEKGAVTWVKTGHLPVSNPGLS